MATVLQLFLVVLFAYAITSWFPAEPGGGLYKFRRTLASICEPVIAPVRRVIPPVGGLDLSFMVVMLLVWVLVSALGGGLLPI